MTEATPIRQVPLAQQVQNIILDRIIAGTYPPGSQLPPEDELGIQLGVSRTTVRGALDVLVARGTVNRRHGAGTFVSRISHIRNPLDEAIDFQDLLRKFNFEPDVQYIHSSIQKPSAEITKALKLDQNVDIFKSYKIFTADMKPIIYCVNTMPLSLFDKKFIEELTDNPSALEPLYDVLKNKCNLYVENHLSRIHPATAENCDFFGGLPLEKGTPILVIDAIAYDTHGHPLFHTFEYTTDNEITYELIRRRTPGS
jgi:GntR family transcriptional regulator